MGGGRKDMDGRKSVNGGYDPNGRKSRIPAAYPVTMVRTSFITYLKKIGFHCVIIIIIFKFLVFIYILED